MEKRKLLYITNQICGPGGLERVLSIKASYLAEKLGYEVYILTLNQGSQSLFYEFSPNIKFFDIKVEGNPINYILKYRSGIRRVIKKLEPDIISVCDDGLKGLFVPITIGRFCPMIYERHVSKLILSGAYRSFWEKYVNLFKNKLMDIGGQLYDSFICLTEDNAKEWGNNNIHIIPNPLSFYPEKFSNLENKEVIAVGRLFFQKGYPFMIEAWRKVITNFPDWKLNIYGGGPDEAVICELIRKYGLQESIHIHKPVDNIVEKYLESSVYVMSSRFEGFGMVLIEAMACGVPCVSFNCPCGPSSIIDHGEDGFLVPTGNIDDLSSRLMELMSSRELRIKMGAKARQNVIRFSPKIVVQQWDELFEKLVNKL